MNSFKNYIKQLRGRPLSDESRLSFAAAIGFLAVGGLGWLANRISPGSNVLSALLAVGGFYLILGIVSLFKKPKTADLVEEDPTLVSSFKREFRREGDGESPGKFNRRRSVQTAA